jgi:hypothetical protein
MIKILVFVILTSTVNLYAQDESIKNLFPGKWKMDFDKSKVFEEWDMLSETELVGKSYSLEDEVQIIREKLYLKKFADQWAYVAVPNGQNIALFALIEYSPKKFVFENKEHDFPQRIIYEFHKDGKLTAAIEGDVNGKLKRKEFSFILVEE